MKKFKFLTVILSIYLSFLLVLPVTAAENKYNNYCEENNLYLIDIGDLPKDDTPLSVIYSLDSNNYTRDSKYIVFQMTRSLVIWNCVGVPGDQKFSGYMNLTDLTSGMSCGSNIAMIGRSGSVAYMGLPGHQYRMSFYGSLWKTDSNGMVTQKVSDESGGWVWQVPN